MKQKLVIIGLMLCAYTNSNAQLLNKIQKTANQANNAVETVKTAEEVVNTGEKVAKKVKNKGGASSGTSSLKLDWNMYKQTPAVTFNSLLYATNIGTGGLTQFTGYTATFVPNKTAAGATVNTVHDQAEFLKIKMYLFFV